MATDLLSALERADGPSRELDALIEAWLYERENSAPAEIACDSDNVERGHYWVRIDGGRTLYSAPPITASVDAAIALVERALPNKTPFTYHWGVQSMDATPFEPKHYRYLGTISRKESGAYDPRFSVHTGYAPTPALALCLALVRALASEGEQT